MISMTGQIVRGCHDNVNDRADSLEAVVMISMTGQMVRGCHDDVNDRADSLEAVVMISMTGQTVMMTPVAGQRVERPLR